MRSWLPNTSVGSRFGYASPDPLHRGHVTFFLPSHMKQVL